MKSWLGRVWRLLSGQAQWWVLWLAHSKFNVGVCTAFFDDDGRVLLLRHVFRREDRWGLPAGWAAPGETVFQTAQRELREETGMCGEPVDILEVNSGYRLRVEIVLFGHINASQSARLSHEIHEAAFHAVDALPDSLTTIHRNIIFEAVRRREQGQGT